MPYRRKWGDGDGFIAKFALGARAGADQTPPTIQLLQPTSNSEWATGQARLSLAGTAADNVGVTEVFWRREQPDADLAAGITWARASGAGQLENQ